MLFKKANQIALIQIRHLPEFDPDQVPIGSRVVQFPVPAKLRDSTEPYQVLGAGQHEIQRLQPFRQQTGPRLATAFGDEVDQLLVVPQKLAARRDITDNKQMPR